MKQTITSWLKPTLILLALLTTANAFAVPVFNAPAVRIQPNGDTLHCLLSGDEYYHRLHDSNGYTIVQNPQTGYWVYADTVHNGPQHWELVATNYAVGSVDPARTGISPNLGIDQDTWNKRQRFFDIPPQYAKPAAKTSGRNHGTLNNIVIFVRFSDDSEISTSLSTIDAMFNDSTSGATSMYNYFKTVSYNKIHIPTHYYPTPNGNNIISYQDTLPRSYYMPYDATINTNGYQGDNERRSREFDLLERAIDYVNANSPVDSTLNLDMDNDGYVDNICFVVKGTYTGWSELLWPHKWAIYDRYVFLNGKRVYTFNLQLEGSGAHYFSSSTFCHEMFHTLGAPDLYRYNNNTNVTGVGSWDLMCSNTTPPQTMGAYMKWKYGNWIDSIPEITVQGTYTLHSLGDADYSNIVYKIAAQEPHQWYVLEYRDNTEQFETTLPGRGLIIYRIDDRFNGNANFNGTTDFDEVYLFRPNAPNDTTNGNPAQAFFSYNANRTQFSQTSNPRPWLTGNVIDTTISITEIGSPGQTISFTYNDLRGCATPSGLTTTDVTGVSAHISWSGNAANYTLQWRPEGTEAATTVNVDGTSYDFSGLSLDSEYEWRVRGVCSATDSSEYTSWQRLRTSYCLEPSETTIGIGETTSRYVPLSNYHSYSYSQMIYTQAELGEPMTISRIAFDYNYYDPITVKNHCYIYLGHTDQAFFTGTAPSQFVPFNQLTKVYEGPLNVVYGWNEFALDSTFLYNGIDNLVVAIYDSSDSWENINCVFNVTRTGSLSTTMSYYSDGYINPRNLDNYDGDKSRFRYRPDITFIGCQADTSDFHIVTVASSNPDHGSVSVTGGGTILDGHTATIEATAAEHYNFSHWHSNISGHDVTDNPYTFTVEGDSSFTAYFTADQFNVSVSSNGICGNAWFQVWEDDILVDIPYTEGTLDYGTRISIFADQVVECEDNYSVCSFIGWDPEGHAWANPINITLNRDTAYTAYYSCVTSDIDDLDESGIDIAVANGSVTISGAQGRAIELLDITGRSLTRTVGTGHDTFALPAVGVYIVRIEGLPARKIINK